MLQRLDRGLLVHAKHDRVLGRIQVEPDNVLHFGRELPIATHFVGAHEVRFHVASPQTIRHRAAGDPESLRQQPRRPTRPSGRRWRHRQIDDLVDHLGRKRVALAAHSGLLGQPLHSTVEEAPAYPRNALTAHPDHPADLGCRVPLVGQQHRARTPHHTRSLRRPRDDLFERTPLFRGQPDLVHSSHHGTSRQIMYVSLCQRRCSSSSPS